MQTSRLLLQAALLQSEHVWVAGCVGSLQPPPRLGPTQVLAGIGVGFALISEALACSFQDLDAACHPLAALRGAVLTVLLSLPGVVYFTRLYLPFPTSAPTPRKGGLLCLAAISVRVI